MNSHDGAESSDSVLSASDVRAAARYGYELRSVIGRGGMGVVYAARQIDLDREVAIKTIDDGRLEQTVVADRFHREALAIARLKHPSIVTALNYCVAEGTRFLVMELVDGMTLADWIERYGSLSPQDAWDAALQVAGGLSHAASKGVTHRDIKPANLMVVPYPDGVQRRGIGQIKITDFGLAMLADWSSPDLRLTGVGRLVGSPAYMPPERFDADDEPQGSEMDVRSDVYALGVTLVSMRSGRHPFDQGSLPKLIKQKSGLMDALIASKRLGQWSEGEIDLINRMTHPDPDERPSDYTILLAEIARLVETLPTNVDPKSADAQRIRDATLANDDTVDAVVRLRRSDGSVARTVSNHSRRWRRIWVVAVVGIMLLLGVGGAVWQSRLGRVADIKRTHTGPGDRLTLFDGRTLSGFAMGGDGFGSWAAATLPGGGNALVCTTDDGMISRPLPPSCADTPIKLAVFVQATADRVATVDPPELRIAVKTGADRWIEVRCGRDTVAAWSVNNDGSSRSLGIREVDLPARLHVIHFERQPDGWFVFVEQEHLASFALPIDRGSDRNPAARIEFYVDDQSVESRNGEPFFYLSDLQCQRLHRVEITSDDDRQTSKSPITRGVLAGPINR